ncbi:MAG: hypothetical protein PHI49_11720 [Halothiobacillaceae bacterium]|nr:hypothetical protein [Halothiobacillaceae bacterium]
MPKPNPHLTVLSLVLLLSAPLAQGATPSANAGPNPLDGLLWHPPVLSAAPRGGEGHTHGPANQTPRPGDPASPRDKPHTPGWQLTLGDAPASQARVTLIAPDLSEKDIPLAPDGIRLPRTGMDNYHALIAHWREDGRVLTAIRYLSQNGKPSGHSPAEVIARPKARLDIVPDPLPREHWRYQAERSEHFRLLFDGKPLADTPVLFVTDQGSHQTLRSDPQGRVKLTPPDDLPADASRRQAGEMRLGVRWQTPDGEEHITQLSAAYYPPASRWQSLPLGLLALLIGLGLGLLVRPGLLAAARPTRRQPA